MTGDACLILCYHAVSSSWRSQLATSEEILSAQMALLRRRGYIGLTFLESERRRANGTLPERSVVITFDDGFHSIQRARPILERYGFPATVFVVTDFIDSGELLSWPGIEMWVNSRWADKLRPLSWDELRLLVASGWEVGSHTATHKLLPDLDDDHVRDELERSRTAIAATLGSCETIAYPYGLADARVARGAEQAGYAAGCTLTAIHPIDQPYLRPRVGLSHADNGVRLRAQVSPAVQRFRKTRVAQRLRRRSFTRSWLPPRPGG